MKMGPESRLYLLVLWAVVAPPIAIAQTAPSPTSEGRLAVYLDCKDWICDYDHFRRDIAWVDWVRDREYADVHLLITSQQTGGNGKRFTLDYLGRGRFETLHKSIPYVSSGEDTDTEVRNGLTRTIALGLVGFVEQDPSLGMLRIVYDGPAVATTTGPVSDPWNLWVFRVSADGSIEGEAQQSGYSARGSASARRIADLFKVELSLNGRFRRDEYELDEAGQTETGSETIVSTLEDYSADGRLVWSLGDHWSAGGRVNANHSTFYNRALAIVTGPAIEYNIFPYRESTRRQLTFRYQVEGVSAKYLLRTVENKTSQLLTRHSLVFGARVQQPWGEIFGLVEGIQYLHDLPTHRINTMINLEYRLFRGFNLDIRGGLSRIKDQFYLPGEGLTQEEILLQRKQRETDYEYDINFGISYQFGSRYANVVNPRMDGGRWFFF